MTPSGIEPRHTTAFPGQYNIKVKPYTPWAYTGGTEVYLQSLTLALNGVWSHAPTTLPRGKETPVPIEQTSGRTPEPGNKFWGREKIPPPPRGGFVFLLNFTPWQFGCLSSARKTKLVIFSTLHSNVRALCPVIHITHIKNLFTVYTNCRLLNLLQPTGYIMHYQFTHSTTVRSAHTVFTCFVFIWVQTATCATYNINWLVFYNRDEKCLQRGTDWVFKYSSLRFVFKGLIFMCFVFIWEQTATCATYSINWLGFMTEMNSVYCAVRTRSLNKAVCASFFKG